MVEIRLAAPGDVDGIWDLVRRAVAQMRSLGSPQWGEDYPTRAHYVQDQARGELYAAFSPEGALLGAACLNTDQASEYAPLPWAVPAPALVVHRMAVDPDLQRQGVGRSFFVFAEALARSRGIPALHVDTYAQNRRMQRLFLACGFSPVGAVHFDREDRPLGFPCFEKVL